MDHVGDENDESDENDGKNEKNTDMSYQRLM